MGCEGSTVGSNGAGGKDGESSRQTGQGMRWSVHGIEMGEAR